MSNIAPPHGEGEDGRGQRRWRGWSWATEVAVIEEWLDFEN